MNGPGGLSSVVTWWQWHKPSAAGALQLPRKPCKRWPRTSVKPPSSPVPAARPTLAVGIAQEGIQLLVSSIVSGTTSPVSIWFKSVPSGVDTPSQLTQGEQWLSQVDQFLFRNIHASNFDSEVTDFLTDLVVAGWAVLYADTNRDKGGFTFNTWSIGNCYVSSTQANGLIDTIYREFELSAEQIVSEFGIDNVSDKVKTALEKKT